MKHKRLILTAVLLACVAAVMVPFGGPFWLAVAYEKADNVLHGDLEPTFVWAKKFSWLPGRSVRVPDQVCLSCKQEEHACHGVGHPVVALSPDYWQGRRLLGNPWSCTCLDPSHKWNR